MESARQAQHEQLEHAIEQNLTAEKDAEKEASKKPDAAE
jgi:hypothetical protein